VQFESNGERVNIHVSLNGNTSFNVSSLSIEVSEDNNVEVPEGNDLVLEWDEEVFSRAESWASALKAWADVLRWGRGWRWEWVWWADESVDLVGSKNCSDDNDSLPYSKWVI